MSSKNQQTHGDGENPCVVCFKNVPIYSIGVCDHPVCYDCSTRMRVLCKQKECPICRGDMPKVIYTKEKKSYAELMRQVENSNLQEVRFGMYFCSPSIQKAYYRLLEFNCQICPLHERRYPFKNFNQLRDHMRREHELFYCDLCVDNLKIFAFERKCYTRSELAQHRRKGDADNTSHRGHPLCEFCDQRYMDSDELFRHLRRDHLYCHFCDADGKHQYYATYDDLKVHFLEEHFLCEEGDCKNEQFTSVFRTDIDYKAHIASVHSKHLSKAATKHARTLEVEFNFAPRRNDQGRQRGRQNRNNDDGDAAAGHENYNMEPGGNNHQTFVNPLRDANFPSLNNQNEGAVSVPGTSRTSVTFTSKMTPKFSGDEFPSLGGGTQAPKSNITITNQKQKKGDDFPNLGASRNITITKTSASAAGAGSSAANLVKSKQNFPTLRKDGGSKPPATSSTLKFTLNQERPQSSSTNVSIQVNHKSNGLTTRISTAPTMQVRPMSVDAFPALGPTVPVKQTQQWVQAKPKKQVESRVTKTAPAPVLPSSSLADFPSLSKKVDPPKPKKTSTVTMPVTGATSNKEPEKKTDTKKSKKNKTNETKQDNMGNGKFKDSNEREYVKNKFNESKYAEKESLDTKNKNKKKKNKTLESAGSSGSNEENGIVKKTSTLKIGTLEIPEASKQPPPGLAVKPPGIAVKPPPGFNLLPKNDLTFTSSSGQSYPILPTASYHPPPNFNTRNTSLVSSFVSVLKTNEAMNEFKSYSDLFRRGAYPAEKYYEHCQGVLKDSFGQIFPELLVLLPNVERQQELYRIYKAKSKTKDLMECASCRQVIYSKELKQHQSNHFMENHFPSLGQSVDMNNVWKK